MADGNGSTVNTKVISASISAPIWSYIGTLLVYILNGMFFHCWTDPTSPGVAAAWSCVAHMPETITQAIEGLVTGLGTFLVGWLTPHNGSGS